MRSTLNCVTPTQRPAFNLARTRAAFEKVKADGTLARLMGAPGR